MLLVSDLVIRVQAGTGTPLAHAKVGAKEERASAPRKPTLADEMAENQYTPVHGQEVRDDLPRWQYLMPASPPAKLGIWPPS